MIQPFQSYTTSFYYFFFTHFLIDFFSKFTIVENSKTVILQFIILSCGSVQHFHECLNFLPCFEILLFFLIIIIVVIYPHPYLAAFVLVLKVSSECFLSMSKGAPNMSSYLY